MRLDGALQGCSVYTFRMEEVPNEFTIIYILLSCIRYVFQSIGWNYKSRELTWDKSMKYKVLCYFVVQKKSFKSCFLFERVYTLKKIIVLNQSWCIKYFSSTNWYYIAHQIVNNWKYNSKIVTKSIIIITTKIRLYDPWLDTVKDRPWRESSNNMWFNETFIRKSITTW